MKKMKKLILLITLVPFLIQAQNQLLIENGASLTIGKKSFVKVKGNLYNDGSTLTLNSDSNEFSSIIVDGSSSGNVIYNRYVNVVGDTGWDLIGSPVNGLTISSFATSNDGSLATSGSTYAIGVYDSSADSWTNYTSSSGGNFPGSTTFDIGKGYQMASQSASGQTLKFTGTIATTDQTQAIQDYSGGSGRIWNLVANPYPSYINANNNANSSDNFLKSNFESDDHDFIVNNLHDSYVALYGYDADGSGYTIYNQSSAATYIAPGQAFMVASDNSSAGTSISFTEAMQTTLGSDDFIVGDIIETSFELILKLHEGDSEIGSTRFYFEDGLELDLDPGYDAGHFNQSASLMSRLAEEDEGVGFAINAMGLENVNDVVVPIVINREAGTDFRISIDTFGIYAGTNVYLEDNEQGTLTLLNEGDFELNPESTLSEAGRFFIHLTESTFSVEDEVETNLLNVFKADYNNFITVEGLAMQSGITNVKLYSVLGREILSTELNNSTNTQTISTEIIATGIYIIKLQSGNRILTKKLIIK